MNHVRFEGSGNAPDARSQPALLGFPGATDGAPVDRDRFVGAMKGAATGVNIVTTSGPAGRFGLTVSAFASVSAEPPMVLVCVNRRSPVSAAILENRRFCVNVLALGQRDLADTFAGRSAGGPPYDFARARWGCGATGAPLLEGAVASFDCTLATALESGTHTVLIGLVKAAIAGDGEALVYQHRAYGFVGRGF